MAISEAGVVEEGSFVRRFAREGRQGGRLVMDCD